MKKVGKIWWNVGTNSITYVNLFIKKINHLFVGQTIFSIDKNIYDSSNNLLCSFGSLSTLEQTLTCWAAFGYVKKVSKNTWIIINSLLTFDELIEVSKANLLVPAFDKKIDRYKDSILIKIKLNVDNFFYEKGNFFSIRKVDEIKNDKILKSIGQYEKIIMKDSTFLEFVKIL